MQFPTVCLRCNLKQGVGEGEEGETRLVYIQYTVWGCGYGYLVHFAVETKDSTRFLLCHFA